MAKNILVLFISLTLSFLLLEGFSRLVFPIQYGNKSFDISGQNNISIFTRTEILVPDLEYRQMTQEFDVITHHTRFATRGPDAPDNPDIIFVGDSMTYGIGLADEDNIPHNICKKLHKKCINLGLPGSSTISQVRRLETYLEQYNWKPELVVLIPNVMTAALMGGNDLSDNFRDKGSEQKTSDKTTPVNRLNSPQKSFAQTILNQRFWVLEHINLARITYYILAPMLREAFTPGLKDEELAEALALMQAQLEKLEALSQKAGFEYQIYLVHPMQDVMRGSWQKTESDIQAISLHAKIVSTAPAFADMKSVSDYYYPLDGHVKPAGAKKIVSFITNRINQPSQ